MSQNNDTMFLTFKEERDPEKIANTLLARYIGINKKKIYGNKIREMKRLKGQSIIEVMGQVDVLTDRIVQKCKDPKEKEYKKKRIMIEALIQRI